MSAAIPSAPASRPLTAMLQGSMKLAEAAAGAVAVSGLMAVLTLVRGLAGTDAWIFFFLVTKPLVDLTWRWKFFEAGEQDVNIQTVVGLLLLALNAIVFFRKVADRRLPRGVLAFLAAAIFSLVCSPSSVGLNELVRLFSGSLFFYTAGPLLANVWRFNRFAKSFLAITAIPIFLSFLQQARILPFDYWDWIDGWQIGRVSGTYPTPLNLIFLLIYAMPLAMYIAGSKHESRLAKKLAWVFLAGASVAVAFTYHRAAYIVITLEFLGWLYLSGRKKAAAVFLAAMAGAAVLSFTWLRMFYGQALGDSGSIDGEFFRGRGLQWYLFLNSLYTSGPFHWIFGNGGSVMANLDPQATSVLSSDEPHNDFIRILHAYGMVGLALYLSILGQFYRKAVSMLRDPEVFPRSLARIVLLALVSVVLLSVTTEPMRYPSAVWYLFALSSGLYCVERPREPLSEAAGA
jgi:hypothetical protein